VCVCGWRPNRRMWQSQGSNWSV